MKYLLTRVILPVVIVGIGVACAGILVLLGPSTSPADGPGESVAVEVIRAAPATRPAAVAGTGVVEADVQIGLVPEVGGRVIWIADNLRPGRRFEAGQTLARIDARDYEAALQSERARLQQARLELAMEQERKGHSERQWQILGDGRDSEQARLALRKPHLKLAEANLLSAEASIDRAERNLARTALVAPFNAVVLMESLDRGQTVVPGAPVATLAGTDLFRVPVSVPVEQLTLLDIPGINAEHGSAARVVQQLPGQRIEREGSILGIDGALDPRTRTAVVLVGIDDPLETEGGTLPLLPGAFVDVTLTGRALSDAVSIPRTAVVDGDRVWIVEDGLLASRSVEIPYQDADLAWVTAGLDPGDLVVTSRMATPLVGQPATPTEPPAEVGALEPEG